MDTNNLLWVLDHKIRLLDTDESYGMVEITSLPQIPGPPPHFHKSEHEFSFSLYGRRVKSGHNERAVGN